MVLRSGNERRCADHHQLLQGFLLAPEPELMQIVAVPGTLPETARERAVHGQG